jgi:hypothetical protein
MNTLYRNAALALAAASLTLPAIPAAAADFRPLGASRAPVEQAWENGRDRGRHNGWNRGRGNPHRSDRYDRYDNRAYGYQPTRSYYSEPVYRDTRVWRGNDGQYYCQKRDGTTGLIIGAAAGAIIGREVDSRGDRTLGTVLGAAAGAILGKKVAQGGSSCR